MSGKRSAPAAPFRAGGLATRLYGVMSQMGSTSLEATTVATTSTTCISIPARPISGKNFPRGASFQGRGMGTRLCGVSWQMVSISLEATTLATTSTTFISIPARPISGKNFFPGAPSRAGGSITRLCGVMLQMGSSSLEAVTIIATS